MIELNQKNVLYVAAICKSCARVKVRWLIRGIFVHVISWDQYKNPNFLIHFSYLRFGFRHAESTSYETNKICAAIDDEIYI